MSLQSIFSVLDAASGAFGSPFVVPHVGVALRAFTDQVNNPVLGNNMHYHAADFALYELGSFDDSNGVIASVFPAKLIAQAASLKSVPTGGGSDVLARE